MAGYGDLKAACPERAVPSLAELGRTHIPGLQLNKDQWEKVYSEFHKYFEFDAPEHGRSDNPPSDKPPNNNSLGDKIDRQVAIVTRDMNIANQRNDLLTSMLNKKSADGSPVIPDDAVEAMVRTIQTNATPQDKRLWRETLAEQRYAVSQTGNGCSTLANFEDLARIYGVDPSAAPHSPGGTKGSARPPATTPH